MSPVTGAHLPPGMPDQGEVQVLSLTDPATPAALGAYAVRDRVGAVVVVGTHAYLACSRSVDILDVRDLTRPRLLSSVAVGNHIAALAGTSAAVDPATLGGLQAITLADPAHPQQAGAFATVSGGESVAAAGSAVFVLTSDAVQRISMADPARPQLIATYPLHPFAQGLAVAGPDLYVLDATGLHILDVSDPTQFKTVAGYRGEGHWTGVAVAGNAAYLVDQNDLVIVDVTHPAVPRKAGQVALLGGQVAVSGGMAYVAGTDSSGRTSRLTVVDVHDPNAPHLLGSATFLGAVKGVAVRGGAAYVAVEDIAPGLDVFDVSGPGVPVQTGVIDPGIPATGVAISKQYAYVVNDGLSVLDVADPLHPVLLGKASIPVSAAVAASDGIGYAPGLGDGLWAVQVVGAPPATPQHDPRFFSQTGFRIDDDAFWNYFQGRGGVQTFGYPISRSFILDGLRVQCFQRQVMQRLPDGSLHLFNLADPGLLPYTSFNGSVVPAPDPVLVALAPPVGSPTYATAVAAFVQRHVPDVWQGLPVHFAQTFWRAVSVQEGYPNGGGNPALLPLRNLEVWDLPTSAPAFDPHNHHFVYQRFQRGVMLYDAACACTRGLLLGDYLKAVLTGQRLPAELAREAASSPFLDQYDPGAPNWLRHPELLPDTNLIGAFTPQ